MLARNLSGTQTSCPHPCRLRDTDLKWSLILQLLFKPRVCDPLKHRCCVGEQKLQQVSDLPAVWAEACRLGHMTSQTSPSVRRERSFISPETRASHYGSGETGVRAKCRRIVSVIPVGFTARKTELRGRDRGTFMVMNAFLVTLHNRGFLHVFDSWCKVFKHFLVIWFTAK